jgi:hypothetical protein
MNASKRIESDVKAGKPLPQALAKEKKVFKTHETARRGRMGAAANAARAANLYGDILGWYLNPLLNNEIECVTANGHNFSASQGTVIGYPGAVHPRCGCTAGPPILGAGMVNDALKESSQVIFQAPRKYRLKRTA